MITIYVVYSAAKNQDSWSFRIFWKLRMETTYSLWGKRLKEARKAAGFSQKKLGIKAGLDEFVASTRINRYEQGVHKADYQITQKIACVLNIPTGYFYTEDDDLAELMCIYYRLKTRKRKELIRIAKTIAS